MKKINILEKFNLFSETWQSYNVAQVQDMRIKLARIHGEFLWHKHDNEDELFLVIEGTMVLRFRDHEETLGPGEFIVVPRGVEHMPVAREEVKILLLEPASTKNTGEVENERTTDNDLWL